MKLVLRGCYCYGSAVFAGCGLLAGHGGRAVAAPSDVAQ